VIAIYVEPLNIVFELHPLNFIEWGVALIVSMISVLGAGVTMRIPKKTKTEKLRIQGMSVG
jgi:hypothetical protein